MSRQYLKISELGEDEGQQNDEDNEPTNFSSKFSITQTAPTKSNRMEINGTDNESDTLPFNNNFENVINPRQFRANISICFQYLTNKFYFQRITHRLDSNLTGDESILIYGRNLCEDTQTVRLLKFFLLTITCILVTHPLIRLIGWEYDSNFALSDFFEYDFPSVCLDIISFYLVGRLYQRRGTDRFLSFILPMIFGCIQPSWEANWKFLQNSVSIYAIVCTWPFELFVFVFFLSVLIIMLIFVHVRYAIQNDIFISRLLEFGICMSIFLFPFISNPNFHFHHWYASWLFGMHSNMGTWWSDMILAFSWGTYVNGIAAYGRDPILSCAYSFYLATDNRCYFMECYSVDDDSDDGNGYKPFVPPNWHNCSAS